MGILVPDDYDDIGGGFPVVPIVVVSLGIILWASTGLRNDESARRNEQMAMAQINANMVNAGPGISWNYAYNGLGWPLAGGVGQVSSAFGVPRERGPHKGADIFATRGTSIVAPADGIVEHVFVDHPGSRCGNGMLILHRSNPSLETRYCHMDNVYVSERSIVRKGQSLGTLGRTGIKTTGPHLHFAVEVNGVPVDPIAAVQQ